MHYAVTEANGTVVVEGSESGGSNNIAELIAVREALKWAKSQGWLEADIRTDSRNNLSWAKGSTPGKKINDRARVLEIQREIKALDFPFSLTWVPREDNIAGQHLESL